MIVFRGVLFSRFQQANMKKGPLNFAIQAFSNWFYFSKSLNFLKFLDKLEQVMCEIFAINAISKLQWRYKMELLIASKTNQQFVCLLNIMYMLLLNC